MPPHFTDAQRPLQPSPQHTQDSQAIAVSGTEPIRATPRSTVLGQNPKHSRFQRPQGNSGFWNCTPKSRLLGGSVTSIEHGHNSTSTPSVHD